MRILGVVASSSREVPNAPTIGTATDVGTGRAFNNGAATVTFTAPTWTGGLPITGYTVTSSPGGYTGTGSSSPITVAGLQSNTNYTFTVRATNGVGQSAASAASNSILATTIPQAPTIGTATATGSSTATVGFTGNATGGKAVSTYTATSNPGSITGSSATSPITVSGLTSGTAYTFTVTATNANGTSAASAASNSVTPSTPGYIFTLAYGSGGGYGGGGYMRRLSSGNLAVVTAAPGTGSPYGSFYVLNSSGTIQSQRGLDASATNGQVFGGGVDSAGNFIGVGYANANTNAGTYKFNSSGTVVWARYSTSAYLGWGPVNFDSSDNFHMIWDAPSTYGTFCWDKINGSNGVSLMGSLGFQLGKSNTRSSSWMGVPMVQDSAGNAYSLTSPSTNSFYLTKFNSSFSQLAQIGWGFPGFTDYISCLQIDSNDNIYLITCENAAPARAHITKWDTSLNLVWQRQFTTGNPFNDYYSRCVADSSGNLFVLLPFNNGAGDQRWVVARYNSSGTLQWQRQWQSSANFLFTNKYGGIPTIVLDGNDYIISVPANGGGNITIKAPQDGTKTGSYVLGGVTYTYSASSLTEVAGGLGNNSASTGWANPVVGTVSNSNNFTSAGTQATALVTI